MPSSKKCVPGSMSAATRSRAVRRFFFALRFDSFGAAALADLSSSFFDGGEEFHHVLGILFEIGGFCVDRGFQNRCGHAATSQTGVAAAESVYGGLKVCASGRREEI